MGVRAAGRALLALLLGATGWVAVTAAPGRAPAPGAETTLWLAAHSLAADHDELFVDTDVARFRAAFAEAPRSVRTAVRSDRLAAPYLAAHLWSWALVLGGERGPFLLNAVALMLAAVAGSRALRAALGAAAPLWIALFLFGSVAFTYVFRWQSELLVFAAVVLAGALVWGREATTVVDRGPDQIYGGDVEARAALWPWPLAGLLIGAAAVRHPAYALLAIPMLFDLPQSPKRGGRVAAGVLFVLPLLAPLGFVLAAHGAPWETPAVVLHPSLFGWNALYLVAGRNAGVLVGFLPVLALLLSRRRAGEGGGRRFLPLVVLVAAVAQLLSSPFDWAGDLSAVGNPWFLPLYGALWFCAGPALRLRGALLLTLATAPVVAPYWISPLSDGTAAPAALAGFTSQIRERLPFETTLRELPGSCEIVRAGVRLRGTGPSIQPVAGRLAWQSEGEGRGKGERRTALLVESDRALSSVRLDFSANASATLAVEGGTAGSTTFRPSGEVAFDITLGRAARRHPLWWSRAPVSIYFLGLALPEAGMPPRGPTGAAGSTGSTATAKALTFDLGLARIARSEAARP